MTSTTRFSDLDGTRRVAGSTYTYDDAGRLTNLTHDSDGEVLSAYEWAYDKANRITQAVSPDGVSNYNYDKSDQLVDADYDYQDDESYVYDENGNRVNDGYVTGKNNQLLSDGTYNYEYDNEGNRVTRTEIATGEVTEYEWDYRNRLIAVETEDSEGNVTANSEYTYDVFDRRIAKSVNADGDGVGEAVVERYVHDGDHIALTFDESGNLTERFLHGLGIDQVLAQENAGGEVLWALADNQGSVRMVLDNQGNVVNNITYDAFGNITVETNPDVNFRFSYTGRELDPETGLYNYRSRYYDPGTGQFINEDTIGFAGGDSNLYRYVSNSPLNYTDPDGQVAIAGVLLLTAAVVIAADLLSPDGAHTPTMPTDRNGNRLTSEDLNNPSSCNDSPIYDNPQDLDRSLQRAGVEVVLGGLPSLGKGLVKNAPQLLRSLSDDAINALDNILPRDLGSIPVPVEGAFDDLAKQADKFDDLIANGLDGLNDAARGLGTAADGLFKPFFEARKAHTPINDGNWTGTRGNSDWVSSKKDVNDITGGKGVPFKNDYPDFSKWSQGDVQIPKMTGKNSKDFSQADKAFAEQQGWLKKNGTPNRAESQKYRQKNGLTWHHNQDGKTMQLIPTKLHGNVPHTGGGSLSRP